MKIHIQKLDNKNQGFDSFYAEVLEFLGVPNDQISTLLVHDISTALWTKGTETKEMRRILGRYQDKMRGIHRQIVELNDLLVQIG